MFNRHVKKLLKLRASILGRVPKSRRMYVVKIWYTLVLSDDIVEGEELVPADNIKQAERKLVDRLTKRHNIVGAFNIAMEPKEVSIKFKLWK